MLEAFDKYVSNYDLNDEKIKLKYNHSIRVMEQMVKYAKLLDFNDKDVEIARIIGLLHDIGRFEQLKVYNTFVDNRSVDHADYSVEQLFKKNEIKLFCDDEEIYPLLEFCIKNHNKHHIEETLDERVLKFAKLIRDVDKLDVMYLFGILGELNQKINRDLPITEEVIQFVMRHETVDRNVVKNYNDRLVVQLAFVFDINNDIILKEYKEYLEAYYKQLDDDGRLKEIYDEIIKYIDERILNYERNRN